MFTGVARKGFHSFIARYLCFFFLNIGFFKAGVPVCVPIVISVLHPYRLPVMSTDKNV